MKKIGVYSVLAVSAFGFLLELSPLKAHASPVTDTLTFDGTKYKGQGGNSSGGVATYPYYFTINGNTSTEVPLLCVSFQDKITTGETWQAYVYTIGSSAWAAARTTAEQQEDEADAYLDSLILNPTSSSLYKGGGYTTAEIITDAQWAAWAVGDSQFYTVVKGKDVLNTSALPKNLDDSGINSLFGAAETFVANNTNATFYSGYELFVPITGKWPNGDTTPQTFIGPTVVPEPSSLILFGSGLLSAAGALYRRKRRSA